jgi:hypothetical protein
VRPAQRFLLTGILVALSELSLSLVLEGTWRYFLALSLATAALAALVHRLLDAPPRGGGGPGPGTGDEDPPPPWWPDFERQFRDHVLTEPAPRA